jgi:peptidoglycan/LPS O-acetylase OafA/YrhL
MDDSRLSRHSAPPETAYAEGLTVAERPTTRAAPHLAYRRDIDGLRAVAILAVLFNHTGVRGFFGGYVGVDVFFVISGFLITGILVREKTSGFRWIAEFYRRRVLRIFPALFVMLAVTTAICSLVMLPSELLRYAKSLATAGLFSSNLLFYSEADYFALASQIKPLLHTWSLAIEEQFYLFWPLLLAAVGRQRRARLAAVVVVLSGVSFAAAMWLSSADASAAFYLLPARAWELGIGALLALGANPIRRRWANEALALIGAGLILLCVKGFAEETVLPLALTCGGTALLILTGASGTLVGSLLTLPPMVFVGRISYSLYLWHWPVIVLSGIALFLPRSPLVMTGEILLAMLLATLSWRYVEQPFRQGARAFRTARVLAGGGAAIAVALIVGMVLLAADGLPGRFSPAQLELARYLDVDGDALYRGGSCFVVNPDDRFDAAACLVRSGALPALALIGDSHAAHLWPGLALHRDRFDISQATWAGCKPLLYPAASADDCRHFIRRLLTEWLPETRPAAVLLAARWDRRDLPLLEATLSDKRVKAGHPILIGPIPQYGSALPRLLVFADRRHEPALPDAALVDSVFDIDHEMAAIARRTGTRYISLVDALCHDHACRLWAEPGRPLQFDYGHLTSDGSAVLVDLIMPDIVAAMTPPNGR